MSKNPFGNTILDVTPFEKIELNRNSKKQIRKLRKILDYLSSFRTYKEFGHSTTNMNNVFGNDELGNKLKKCFLIRYGFYYCRSKI